MEKPRTGNDLTAPVPKFCLALEEHRRTPEGRVRSSEEFLRQFLPHDESTVTDQIFRYMPNDVRGPILAAWGIRGHKVALRDSDERVQSVVHESLLAGDIDHVAFEEGLVAAVVVRWVPIADFWRFWRGGNLTKVSIRTALESAYNLGLFDAKWFLESIESQGGKLRGTDVLSEGLSKADLTLWMRRVHESRDGSPKGLLAALGWENVVGKTADPILIGVLDAVAAKNGLKAVAVEAPALSPAVAPGPAHATEAPAAKAADAPVTKAAKSAAAKAAVQVPAPAATPAPAPAIAVTDELTDDDLG